MRSKTKRKNKYKPARPQVSIYEGYEGMKKIYYEALQYALKDEILVYGTISHEYKNYTVHNKLYKLWLRLIKNHKIKMREIMDLTKDNLNYIKLVQNLYNPKHRIRVIPKDFKYRPHTIKMLESDSIIYDNKIALFSSYQDDLYVVVIKDQHISQIYKDLFEMSWIVGEEY